MYNVRNTHQLIPREQTYVLDRKLVTIHSEDRDIKKWPHSNHFEITLPQVMENVESMRLLDCNIPSAYHTFSNDYQNTKLSFKIIANDPSDILYPYIANAVSHIFTITIQDGFYCPDELAIELQTRMNAAISEYITSFGAPSVYENMRVYYDKVGQRFWFGNLVDSFDLLFDRQEEYILQNCEQPNMWDKYTKWGLPSYLGYDRKTYSSKPSLDSNGNATPVVFAYVAIDKGIWMTPNSTTQPVYYVQAPYPPYLLGERAIYMEIKKYNTIDELKPFSERTNQMYNNDYNGIVNAAFAKIPVQAQPLGEFSESRNGFLSNVVMFDIPEEKIAKLEVTFRYHDGRLVEFDNIPFNFTIEFNRLKNEIARAYSVRVPNAYTL
jgi:hypothetical protein